MSSEPAAGWSRFGGPLPLDDVVVLDLGDEATVFGTRLLAELGARVIRVEDPVRDPIRARGPFLRGEPGLERSLAHLLLNGGKESVALELDDPASWEAVERLALASDVVVGPLRPDPRVRGLFDRLEAAEGGPGLVEAVFRRGAPDEQATDLIGAAAGGLVVVSGHGDEPPNHPKGELAYKQCGLTVAQMALALVMEARAGRRPGRAVVSLQEAVNFTTIQTSNANWLHWQGRVPTRHQPMTPWSIYRCGDGRWISFTIHPPNWPKYVDWVETALGNTELSGPEWADGLYRALNGATMAAVTVELCRRHTRQDVIDEGQRRGLLTLPVNTLEDLANDVHLNARGFYHDVWHAQLDDPVRVPRSAFLSNAWHTQANPAPALGQHAPLPEPRPASSSPRATPNRQPLKGVRVLDFCWAIAGPLGTRLLADLGADVIKVESEYRLDPIRYIGVRPPGATGWEIMGQYQDCNAHKRAVTLNLNTPDGLAIVRRLAATADVVTSNYTPDRLDRWGLSYEALKALNPRIIVANLAVMGISGPNMGWRSYGNGMVAASGIGALTGFAGRDPIGIGTLHTDFTVPYFGAIAVMAALHQRNQTGEGRCLEVSQYESGVHLLDTELIDYLNGGPAAERNGNRSTRMAPHGVFPSAGDDRWVAIACRDDADWAALRRVTGITGPDGVAGRLAAVDAIEAALSAWTRQHGNWEASAILQAAGVPASPVEDLGELLGRDTAMNGDYLELEMPTGVTAVLQHEPVLWDGERLPLRRGPMWGEHADEILRGELGISDEEMADLAAKGVFY
ncbi:MAG: CoA transferase [Dehalococcoidia bacterium]